MPFVPGDLVALSTIILPITLYLSLDSKKESGIRLPSFFKLLFTDPVRPNFSAIFLPMEQ